jgi:outer membrane protein assembly factor BamB
VSGHDAASGRRLWHVDEANRFPIPSPLVHEGVIYTSRGYRSSPFLAIRPGGSGDVSATHVTWRVPSGAPYISSLVHQERIGGVYTASPVAADGKVYLTSEDGETIVLAAARAPRILARNRLTARQLASPAISAGRLFIRSDDVLYAIGR